MKKINFKRVAQVAVALFFVFIFYVGYLFIMDREWQSNESYNLNFFTTELAKKPTVTVIEISGNFFSWTRKVTLSDGKKIFFHRSVNPSAWELKKNQKIAVWISPGDLAENKSSCFCGAYEKR